MNSNWTLATAMAACLTASGAASAQEDERSVQPPAPNDSVNRTTATDGPDGRSPEGLGDIVVTAQRRSESLQRAAIPVSVVGGDTIATLGGTSATLLSSQVPALAVNPGGGVSTTFFVRGIGNLTAVHGYTDGAVAFNYDGVFLGRPTSTTGLLFDIERVEVLKGPQGTLYGRNATAGAINVIPVKPELGQSGGFGDISYGNYDALNLQGAANLELGDSAAIRLSGILVDRDGYLTDGTSDEKTKAARAQLLVEVSPELSVRLAGDFTDVSGRGPGSSYAYSAHYDPASGEYILNHAPFDRSEGLLTAEGQAFRASIFNAGVGRNLEPLDRGPSVDSTFYGVTAEVEYESPIGTLTVIPAYRAADQDNVFTSTSSVGWYQEEDTQFSLEARLSGDAGPVDYIVGAYWFDEHVTGNFTFAQQTFNNYQEFTADTRSLATFLRLTGHVSDRLRLVGGVRYTDDHKSFDGINDNFVLICTRRVNNTPSCPSLPLMPSTDAPSELPFTLPQPNGAPAPVGTTGGILVRRQTIVDQEQDFNEVTFRAAVEFDLSSRSLLYASFENGFRSGGFSLAVGRETYQPETIDAYTLGMKNQLFGNRVRLNLEAFYWKYRDQQVSHSGFDSTGNLAFFSENIGRSTMKGFDVEGQVLATENTLLHANIQYLDARFDSFVYEVPAGMAPPFTGCATSISASNPALREIDCSGMPAYHSPKWTANLGARQTVPLGDYELLGSIDTQYRSQRVIGFEHLPHQVVSSTWQSNASLSFSPDDEQWTIGAFIRNIENNRIPVTAPFNAGPGIATVITSPPRTYGVRAAVRF